MTDIKDANLQRINFFALGTEINLQIVSKDLPEKLAEDIQDFYLSQEKIFSRFDKKSELNFLNSNLKKQNEASFELVGVAEKCSVYFEKTGGYFDPRIIGILEDAGYRKDFKIGDFSETKNISPERKTGKPLKEDLKISDEKVFFGCRMDFSGIAKSHITDRAAEFLKERGFENTLVDSGGDIRVLGKDGFGGYWKISLEGFSEENLLISLDEKFQGIATSGISRRKWKNESGRFHHLVNPKKPDCFKFDLKSVTVVAKDCCEADVFAKALFLMGKDEGMIFSRKNNIRAIFLDYRGNIWISEEMKNNVK